MDKLQAMEVFVRVVETGGITRAADSLHMPKATAATLIQKLEVALGVKLLNRTTRRVSVTPDGAAYYERCVSILAEVRETEESLAKQQSTPRGRVRADVPTLMARGSHRGGHRLRGLERRDRRFEPRRAPRGVSLLCDVRRAFLHCGSRAATTPGRAHPASLHQPLLAPQWQDARLGLLEGWRASADHAARLHRARR